MKVFEVLSIFIIFILFTGCNSATSHIKKVGNYPHITWIKEKMLLSKDDKYLFVVNNKTPNQIDILDVSDISKPKVLNKIKVSDKKENNIIEYKLNNHYLYVSLYNKIIIFDINNIYKIKIIKTIAMQRLSSFAKNGEYLYISGCIDSKYCYYLNIYDLNQNKFIKKINIKANFLKISTDKKRLFYGISPTKKEVIGLADITNPLRIKVLDETGKIFNNRGNFSSSARFEDIIFTNDNSKIYIAGNEVGLMVYDISNNKLENIQLTAGTHSKMIFNCTDGIYNISLDKKNNLYLAGVLDNNYQQVTSIKGGNRTLLLSGKKIVVSNRGDFFIVGNSNGLDFYTNLK